MLPRNRWYYRLFSFAPKRQAQSGTVALRSRVIYCFRCIVVRFLSTFHFQWLCARAKRQYSFTKRYLYSNAFSLPLKKYSF